MNTLLQAGKDPMGAAIYDFHKTGKAGKLIVHSSMFDDDEIPVADLFRKFDKMPALEQKALECATGNILDVGAGSGCHSIALMKMGKDVTAIDISPLSVQVMLDRGVHARQVNFYDPAYDEKFDTVLMLMNGTGIIGNLDNIENFFTRTKAILQPDGSVLIDSSDLRYLFEEEDGSLMIDLADEYYGLLDYQMEYVPSRRRSSTPSVLGESFDWLYVDFETLAIYAEESGFTAELLEEGEHYDYLAKLTIN